MVGQFTGNTPLTGHNIQGHSVSAVLVREVPEEVLSTSVTHYGTQGLFGEPTQRTVKHDRDNERRRKWRATQSSKRKAKLNKKAQFEGVSTLMQVGEGREAPTSPSNGHEPGHTSGHWQGISDLHPPLLHGSPLPSPLVLGSSPSPSIVSSPSSQEGTTPSANTNTPLAQGQLLREWTPYSLPDAPSGAPTLNHAPTTSATPGGGRHNELSCPAHVTGPGRGCPCFSTDVCAAASRTDSPNSSQYDGPIDQGHTRPTYNEYATWTAGNSPGRHGCENFVGFPPIAYHTSTAFVTDFDQYHMGMHDVRYSGAHLQPPSPYVTTGALNSSPDATYVADDSTKHFHATTPGLETDHGGRSTTSSQPPPTFWSESPEALNAPPPSAYTTSGFGPDLSTAQENGRSANHFNAAYQDFFVRSSSDSHRSTSQALAPLRSHHYADTPQPAHNGPIPQAYPTEFTAAANASGGASTHGTTVQDFANAGPVSATKPESDQPVVWYAPPTVVPHVDRERSYDIERGANDGCEAQIHYPPLAPPETSTYEGDMRSSPLTPQSSYSELAQALEYPPCAFVDDCAPSSANGSATASRTTASAELDTPLYIHTSNGGVGVHSPGLVFLAPPCSQDVAISEEECARIIQECFDYSDHLLSDISSLLLDMYFATEQSSDVSQQLLTTSAWTGASI